MPKEPTATVLATLCQPKSRGRVELGVDGQPRIVHQFFGDERDLQTMIGGQKLIARLFGSPSLEKLVIAYRRPHPLTASDADWARYIRAKAAPPAHPVGTCRLGRDGGAVTDPQLRVPRIGAPRVRAASVT